MAQKVKKVQRGEGISAKNKKVHQIQIKFLWWGGWGGIYNYFVSNPTTLEVEVLLWLS